MDDSDGEEGGDRHARGMAFTEKTDFDGGEWGDDGEFYARGGARKRKKFSHDDAIYGVFGEDDDDESSDDDAAAGGGRRRRGSAGASSSSSSRLSKPMAFVTQRPAAAAPEGEGGDELSTAGLGSAHSNRGVFQQQYVGSGSDDDDDDSDGANEDDGGGSDYGGGSSADDSDVDVADVFPGDNSRSSGRRRKRGPAAAGVQRNRGRTRSDAAAAEVEVDEAPVESSTKKAGAGMTNAAFRALLLGVVSGPTAGGAGPSSSAAAATAVSSNSGSVPSKATTAPAASTPMGVVGRGMGALLAAHAGGNAAAAAKLKPAPTPPSSSKLKFVNRVAGADPAPSTGSQQQLPKGMGAFEKHTKGFASKYLEKFGFAGRLGKDEQGITQPIAVQVRPERLGLAFGDFKEASQLKANKAVHADFYKGAAAAVEAEGGEEKEEEGGAPRRRQLQRGDAPRDVDDLQWSGDLSLASQRDRARGTKGTRKLAQQQQQQQKPRRKVYRTAAELLASQTAAEEGGGGPPSAAAPTSASSSLVLDMRGPKLRVHSSMADATSAAALNEVEVGVAASATAGDSDDAGATSTSASAMAAGRLGRELLHNVDILADLAEVEVTTAGRKLRAAEAHAASLQVEVSRYEVEEAEALALAEHLDAMHADVASAVERVKSCVAVVDGRVRAAAAAALSAATAASANAAVAAQTAATFPYYGMAKRAALAAAATPTPTGYGASSARNPAALINPPPASMDGTGTALTPLEVLTMGLDDAADAFEGLLRTHEEHCDDFNLVCLGPLLVHTVLSRAGQHWSPPINDEPTATSTSGGDSLRIRDEATAQVLAVLHRWRGLLEGAVNTRSNRLAQRQLQLGAHGGDRGDNGDDSGDEGMDVEGVNGSIGGGGRLAPRHQQQQRQSTARSQVEVARTHVEVARNALTQFASTIEACLLPPLLTAFTTSWWGFRSPRAAIALVHALAGSPQVEVGGATTTRTAQVEVGPPAPGGLLSPSASRRLLEGCILPCLQRAVEAWDPAGDPIPPHDWLLPWASARFIGRGPCEGALWPLLRAKYAAALSGWNPGDPTAHVMLLPWRSVWEPQSLEALLLRTVLPKLVGVLREMEIDPRAQRIEPFMWVTAWMDMLRTPLAVALFAGEFFPKWFLTLGTWLLAPGVDFTEVTTWYSGWKSVIPPSLLSHPSIEALMGKALDLMSDAAMGTLPSAASLLSEGSDAAAPTSTLSGGGAPARVAVERLLSRYGIPTPSSTSFASLLGASSSTSAAMAEEAPTSTSALPTYAASASALRGAGSMSGSSLSALAADAAAVLASRQQQRAAPPLTSTHATSTSSGPASFRDMLELLAARSGLVFLPHPTRPPVKGEHAVYMFGPVPLYISGGVVHAERGGQQRSSSSSSGDGPAKGEGAAGGWAPISIDELLERATARAT